MSGNRGELFINTVALCLVVVLLGLCIAVTTTWAGEVERYMNEGLAQLNKDDYGAAIASFKEALRLNPDSAWVHRNLGDSYTYNGQYDAAIASFKEALRLNPDSAKAHYGLGLAYIATSNNIGALEQYEALKEVDHDMANNFLNLILIDYID
jgi:tetratricopeptide (TPR) repeat protein